MQYLTRVKSLFLFFKKKKQTNFKGKSLFDKSGTQNLFSRRKNSNFIILIFLCSAFFSGLVNADTVANIQNGAFGSVNKEIIYSVNSNTGKATQLAVVQITLVVLILMHE